jgi:Tetratricopeptide repeat
MTESVPAPSDDVPPRSDDVPPPSDDAPPPTDQGASDPHTVDLVSDELGLARAQLDAGLPGLAEGTVRRRAAFLEADGGETAPELDALRVLLAEALWRQGRPIGARAALELVRSGSAQRKLPIVSLIEAEALAASGEPDRAAGALERVVHAIGVDEAFALRTGVPGRLTWPLPGELSPAPVRATRAPWSSAGRDVDVDDDESEDRLAAGRGRLEEARVAYVAGDLARGDGEMSLAVRLDPSLAGDGIAIIEPTLGGQPEAGRLLLYGDLLRAAGRPAEAERAFDRAAERRG